METTAEILKCPECSSTDLDTLSPEECAPSAGEDNTGAAHCNACGHDFNL